jgi:predicted DNA-binding transcriptional regulator AlpA
MNSTRQAHGFRPTRLVASAVVPPVALAEIAQLLEVSKSAATKYALRPDFPKPTILGGVRIWDRDEVAAWGRRTLPLRTGRPPKPRGL